MEYFMLNIEYIPIDNNRTQPHITNENEFVEFLKKHKRADKIYIANQSFASIEIVDLLEKNDIWVDSQTKNTLSKMLFKKIRTNGTLKASGLKRIVSKNGILYDLGAKASHNAMYTSESEVMESMDRVEHLDKVSKEDGKKRMYNTIGQKIRNDIKTKCPEFKKATFKMMKNMDDKFFTKEEYNSFRPYYRQGLEIVNENHMGKMLKNVHHTDITSCYTYELNTRKYPMSQPYKMRNKESFELFKSSKHMWMAKLNIKATANKAYAKYFDLKIGEVSTQFITNLDWECLKKCYDIEYEFIEGYYFDKSDYLPESFVTLITSSFNEKQRLKRLKGTKDFDEAKYNYVKQIINTYTGTLGISTYIDYSYCNIFWSIYTTAWARWDLYNHILLLNNDFVYCNTDSIFSLGDILSFKVGDGLGEVSYDIHPRMVVSGKHKYVCTNRDGTIDAVFSGCNHTNLIEYVNAIGNDLFIEAVLNHEQLAPSQHISHRTHINSDTGERYVRFCGYTL